jgi:hypothetical protein
MTRHFTIEILVDHETKLAIVAHKVTPLIPSTPSKNSSFHIDELPRVKKNITNLECISAFGNWYDSEEEFYEAFPFIYFNEWFSIGNEHEYFDTEKLNYTPFVEIIKTFKTHAPSSDQFTSQSAKWSCQTNSFMAQLKYIEQYIENKYTHHNKRRELP